ncbi:MAG TPA: hypothetical protein DHU26_09125 [Spirochaetaceae bacterium]|nr:hypothetical protein [Spirochaetaceae bacterium]HCX97107.1 hypothetical protein [Spirochaetaceae bacterium]
MMQLEPGKFIPCSIRSATSERHTSGAPQDDVFPRQPSGISPDVQEQLQEKDTVPSAILPFPALSQALFASSPY